MPHRLEWWTKFVAFVTGVAIGIKFAWSNVLVPSWRRWKDYRQRWEMIDRLIVLAEDRAIENTFILEKLHTAWFKSDINGYTTECSYLACSMLETSLDDVIGQNWTSFIIDEDKTRVLNELHDCIEHRKTFKCVYKSYTKTGKIITMRSHAKLATYGWFGTLEII